MSHLGRATALTGTGSMVLFVALSPSFAQSPRVDGMRFVPDVIGQFNALTERADPMGFFKGDSPDPSSCKHYQGMARVDGARGNTYMFVSRSGNTPRLPFDPIPDDWLCRDSPGETGKGNLIIVQMGSRDAHGERMRSNRLRMDTHYDDTPPSSADRVVAHLTFDGQTGLPDYGHPGAMQVVGDVLALAVEHRYESTLPESLIMFFDVGNPVSPRLTSLFSPENETGGDAGVVAITPLPDGHYLMLVTGGSNARVFFYRSNLTDLESAFLTWELIDDWEANPNHVCHPDPNCPLHTGYVPGLSPDEVYLEQNWPSTPDGRDPRPVSRIPRADENGHQGLQFLRQGDIDGPLFLAGARGRLASDFDYIDLYLVECETPECQVGEEILLKHASTRKMVPHANAGSAQLASLAAASTFYASPSGEIIFYATEHDNDGPSESIKAGEWRHLDVVRAESPTLLPTIFLDGPFEIDEGRAGALTGSAGPPTTRAWIQLFEAEQVDSGAGFAIIDYDDYGMDNFHNLAGFQTGGGHPLGFYKRARSWSWYAPVGCTILAIDDEFDDPGIPRETLTLAGTGKVESDHFLSLVPNDSGTDTMDRQVSSVDFLDDCDDYYSRPMVLTWDLDGNGSYETTGASVPFDAAALDGPAVVEVPVQTQHPSGGPVVQRAVPVAILNVAPEITQLRITNGAGQEVGTEVPFVLTELPVSVGAGFMDPGRPDHQVASIAWGDGTVDPETDFASFIDAFGGRTGSLSHDHAYSLEGSYHIGLSVTDDDGGRTSASTVVRVLTPGQAVEEILDLLDAAIAETSNPEILRLLEKAHEALTGNDGASNGVLNKLAGGEEDAAVAMLQQVLFWLRQALESGADVTVLIALVEQVVAALAV